MNLFSLEFLKSVVILALLGFLLFNSINNNLLVKKSYKKALNALKADLEKGLISLRQIDNTLYFYLNQHLSADIIPESKKSVLIRDAEAINTMISQKYALLTEKELVAFRKAIINSYSKGRYVLKEKLLQDVIGRNMMN